MKIITLLLAALLLSGCSYMSYKDSNGRTLTLVRAGQDTNIGTLNASTGTESITINNLTTSQAASLRSSLDALTEVLKHVPILP